MTAETVRTQSTVGTISVRVRVKRHTCCELLMAQQGVRIGSSLKFTRERDLTVTLY